MEKLVNELTQKDEFRAQKAASLIIDNKNIEAFSKLCEKTEFLFDFVKSNVCKRLSKAITSSNYENLLEFFDIYNEVYVDTFVSVLAKYANEDLTDKLYELLESGSLSQKKYAAKYFSLIPDTIAQDLLEQYSLDDDIELAVNSAQALGEMHDDEFYNSIIEKLNTNDEFELMKYVRFLCAYGDKKAVTNLLAILETTTTAENIAGEIPYLMPFLQLLSTQDTDKVLTCFDLVLSGLGEIFSLGDIFFYEVFDVLNILIDKQKNEDSKSSHISQVLLRALDKFSLFKTNDEYSFDEAKDTKEEINAIYDLLSVQNNDFWNEQKLLISKELQQTKHRIVATLETIQSSNITEAKNDLIKFINTSNEEQLIVLAVGVAKSMNATNNLDFATLAQKISDNTLKAILNSYLI